jgi:AraC-like DNA-binding protein
MFYLAGIVITLFLSLILWTKKGKTTADKVLAAWLCVIGIHLFFYYWFITGEIYDHPLLLGLQFPMPLFHGPFLYIYTVTASYNKHFSKNYLLHFVPALLAHVALFQFYLLPAAEKIEVFRSKGAGYEWYTSTLFAAIVISGFVYVLLSFYQLRAYRKKINEEFSDTERINLNWLRYLIYGILTIWIVLILNGKDPLIFAAAVVFVSLLGYFGIKHVGIFTYRRDIVREVVNGIPPVTIKKSMETGFLMVPEDKNSHLANSFKDEGTANTGVLKEPFVTEEDNVSTKYQKSGLQKEEAGKIHQQLRQLMEKEKTFSEEELSLSQLAQRLQIHPNYLSQVINTYEDKSFYDYINNLRIEEFKRLVQLPQNSRYTLLSLAFECGFSSKTSFNRNFKKITGLSPSAYLKEKDLQLVPE